MSGRGRSNNWGFPRWGDYDSSRDTVVQKECDRHGCSEAGLCPAPKSPNNPDRWYFCQAHAAEYNKKWDYFEGLDKAEAKERARAEQAENSGYAETAHYGWGGSGDGTRSGDEMRALELLGLDSDADFEAVKKAYRKGAKMVHPDVKPGDEDAAKQFQALQVAYEVLNQAEARRAWKG